MMGFSAPRGLTLAMTLDELRDFLDRLADLVGVPSDPTEQNVPVTRTPLRRPETRTLDRDGRY